MTAAEDEKKAAKEAAAEEAKTKADEEAAAEAAKKAKEPKVSKTEVHVKDRNGAHVRTFNVKDHGKNFVDVAKEFCETHKAKEYALHFPIIVDKGE